MILDVPEGKGKKKGTTRRKRTYIFDDAEVDGAFWLQRLLATAPSGYSAFWFARPVE